MNQFVMLLPVNCEQMGERTLIGSAVHRVLEEWFKEYPERKIISMQFIPRTISDGGWVVLVCEMKAPPPALNEALRGLEADSHNWSPRPCSTCRAITTALGRPFGCSNPKVNRS